MSETGSPAFGTADASFLAAGGESGIVRLVNDFYQIMENHDGAACVRRLYPDDLGAPRRRLAAFLCGWLGGPRRYAETYGSINIPQFHVRWQVGDAEREAWLECMALAIARQHYSAEFASYLLAQLRVPALRITDAQQACRHKPDL